MYIEILREYSKFKAKNIPTIMSQSRNEMKNVFRNLAWILNGFISIYIWEFQTMLFLWYTRFRRPLFSIACAARAWQIHKSLVMIWVRFIFNYFSPVQSVDNFLQWKNS